MIVIGTKRKGADYRDGKGRVRGRQYSVHRQKEKGAVTMPTNNGGEDRSKSGDGDFLIFGHVG